MESERIKLFQDMKSNGEFNGTFPEFISKYFSAQGDFESFHTSMVNNGDYTKPLKDFYKRFGCDLSWASGLSFCEVSNPPSQPSSLENNRIFMFQNMKADGEFNGTYPEFLSKYFANLDTVKNLHSLMVTNGDYTKSLEDFFLKYACDYSWAENESYCKKAKKTVTPKPSTGKQTGETKPKERVVDLKKCRKSIEDYYPAKEKYQRDFSFEDVEDAFEREEGKHADQMLYFKGTDKRQKQMCARWEDGWRPNFGKPCDETFPIEKWCNNEKMKEIQKCLGLPADRRSGIFDDLTMSKLRAKGISPEESEDISEYEYKIICNKLSSKEQIPTDELFESKTMKFNEDEKKEILRKHLDFKKILQEQKKFLERGLIMEETVPEIESAKAQGCITTAGRYAVRRSGQYQNQTAWVFTATKDTGKWKIDDDIWLYKNGDCEVFDQTDWKVITNCWACDKARVTIQTNTIEDYKRYGWLDINDEDLKVNFAQKDNPQFFIKMKVDGSPDGFLYFPMYKKNLVPENFPPDSPQGKWIANIKQYYPNMMINPTQEEIDRLGLVEISVRGSEIYFPFGLKIYYNKSKGKDYTASGLEASKFRTNRQPSLVECEEAIKGYWEDYIQKEEIDTQSTKFTEMKMYVQSCASQYYKNWKPRTLPDGTKEKLDGFAGIGTGKNILDKKLAALGGIESYDGIPATTQFGSDRRRNPWRITLPQRQ